MNRPLIMVAMPPTLVTQFFPEELLTELGQWGDVVLSPRPADCSSTASQALLARAAVVVTGWGSPLIDASVLAPSPHLQAVVHTAGSVRYTLGLEPDVIVEPRRLLCCVGVAMGVHQQPEIEHRRPVPITGTGQLGETTGDHRLPQAVVHRLPKTQIGGVGQRPDQLCDPHPVVHHDTQRTRSVLRDGPEFPLPITARRCSPQGE